MIIVSQDRKMNFNYKNIETIGIGNPLDNNDGKFLILIETVSDNQYTIAEYETEERAKEVLEEITFAYANMEMLKIPKIDIHQIILATEMIKNICYKMPEK